MDVTVFPGQVSGVCKIPSSKSHTMRAILFAALARGESRLEAVLASPDTDAMIAACHRLGAQLEWREGCLVIQGTAGSVFPKGEIDCGNSGQVLRFIAAIGALGKHPFAMTGDASIRSRRPVHELISVLQQGGVTVTASDGRPPLQICGPLRPGTFHMRGEDSQPVSALLMAAALMEGSSQILVGDLGERPWVGLTLWWLRRLGADITWSREGSQDRFEVTGGLMMQSIREQIAADWSSAAFPLMAGLLTARSAEGASQREGVYLKGLLADDPQGDKEIVAILQEMGGRISWEEGALWVRPSLLRGGRIDANSLIDAVPILAAAGSCMSSGITLENVAMARRKESDRLEALADGIRRLGGQVALGSDWIQVFPGPLQGGEVMAHHDHRIAMAFSVAALRARGPVLIRGCECVAKSYPGFFKVLQRLGAKVSVEEQHVALASQ
jgi:3-phosphoshikimate 1-carboxyvinyltransferase